MANNKKNKRKRNEFQKLRAHFAWLYSPEVLMAIIPKKKFADVKLDALNFQIEIEKLLNNLKENPCDYDSLVSLKNVFAEYKAFYSRLKNRIKRRKDKPWELIELLRKISLNEVIGKIVKYEIEQYDAYIKSNPTASRVNVGIILKDKNANKKLKEKTIVDIYKTLCIPENIKLTIEQGLLENPKELYPMARALKRHFIIHTGGTNTGKTYNALKALKKADTGAYLGPLRLLALEIQEELLENEIGCSMKTGEEENLVENSTHIASTVEMADLFSFYDVVVIDECQMIADQYRGSAWTRAILGMRAENIHLCASPDAVDILVKIIEDCGDDYEIRRYRRKTALKYDNSPETDVAIKWENENGIPKKPSCEDRLKKIDINKLSYGDALIAFSRNDVLNIADLLKENGIEASVIYGALPYESRKKELERFIKGATTVVVATDAIGMGLNLPIKRIIFTSVYKFDGSSYRLLYPSEIKQIAGRAGRKGIYDEGYYYSVHNAGYVRRSMREALNPIEWAYIDFEPSFVEMEYELEEILKAWHEAQMPFDIYRKINLDRTIKLNRKLEMLCKAHGFTCDKDTAYRLSSIIFDDKEFDLINQWMDYVVIYLSGLRTLPYPKVKTDTLEELEISFKKTELYYSFCRSMHYVCDDYWLSNMKKYLSDEISYKLKDNS